MGNSTKRREALSLRKNKGRSFPADYSAGSEMLKEAIRKEMELIQKFRQEIKELKIAQTALRTAQTVLATKTTKSLLAAPKGEQLRMVDGRIKNAYRNLDRHHRKYAKLCKKNGGSPFELNAEPVKVIASISSIEVPE